MAAAILNLNTHSRTVPVWFREFWLQQSPALQGNRPYWRLLEYVLFSNAIRDSNHEPISERYLGADLLTALAEAGPRFNAGQFVADFCRDVVELDIQPHFTGRARTLLDVLLTPEQDEAVERCMRERPETGDRVYFVTGRKFSPRKQKKHIDDMREAATLTAAEAMPEVKALLDYLNNQPQNRFTKILQHWDDTVSLTEGLKHGKYYRRTLYAIKDQAFPVYRGVERSLRVFGIGDTLLNLHADLRRSLCRDWEECDLVSAHLAIFAGLYQVKPIQDFLRGEGNIWEMLAEEAGLDEEDAELFKPVAKTALYSLLYGESPSRISQGIQRNVFSYDAFKDNIIIKSMFAARKLAAKEIEGNEGATDCWGRRITTWHDVNDELYVRSIMSQLGQATEYRLLYPAVQLAIDNQDVQGFRIVLWQFDGFSITARNQELKELWKKRLSAAVDLQAMEMGIETRLAWKGPYSKKPITTSAPNEDALIRRIRKAFAVSS